MTNPLLPNCRAKLLFDFFISAGSVEQRLDICFLGGKQAIPQLAVSSQAKTIAVQTEWAADGAPLASWVAFRRVSSIFNAKL